MSALAAGFNTALVDISQPPNTFLAGPGSGAVNAVPQQRLLVPADLPSAGGFAGLTPSPLFSLFSQTQAITVASSTAATSLIGTGIGAFAGPGPLVFPAGYFTVGKAITVSARGFYSTTATPNLTLKVLAGATALATYGPTATGSGVSNGGWSLTAEIVCYAIGTTATLMCQATINPGTGTFSVQTVAQNVTTSSAISLDVQQTWGTSSASNTFTCTNLSITGN